MISNVCSQTVGLLKFCQIVHELIFFIAFSTSASGVPLLPRLVSPVCVTGGWWWALIHNQLSSSIFPLFISPRTPPSQPSIILSIIFCWYNQWLVQLYNLTIIKSNKCKESIIHLPWLQLWQFFNFDLIVLVWPGWLSNVYTMLQSSGPVQAFIGNLLWIFWKPCFSCTTIDHPTCSADKFCRNLLWASILHIRQLLLFVVLPYVFTSIATMTFKI